MIDCEDNFMFVLCLKSQWKSQKLRLNYSFILNYRIFDLCLQKIFKPYSIWTLQTSENLSNLDRAMIHKQSATLTWIGMYWNYRKWKSENLQRKAHAKANSFVRMNIDVTVCRVGKVFLFLFPFKIFSVCSLWTIVFNIYCLLL